MCDSPKMVTELEAVERERRAAVWAFEEAESALRGAGQKRGADWLLDDGNLDWEQTARSRYPLPKVRRLREVGFPMERIRYNPKRGLFETTLHGDWAEAKMSSPRFVATHVEALADLKANPWEEVDG